MEPHNAEAGRGPVGSRQGLAVARALVVVGVGAALGGCPSLSPQHTARPVPEGERAFSGSIGVYGFKDDDDHERLPYVDAQLRHGLGERSDWGLRTSSGMMLQADLNYAVVLEDDFVLSVDPSVAVLPIVDALVTYLWLPVLADVLTTEDVTVTLSARYGWVSVDGVGDDDLGLDESGGLYGVGVGVLWRVSEKLALLPEFQAMRLTDGDADDPTFYTLSLAFVF